MPYEVIHGRTGYRDIEKIFKTFEAADNYIKYQRGLGRDDTHYLEIDRVDASGSKKKEKLLANKSNKSNKLKIKST